MEEDYALRGFEMLFLVGFAGIFRSLPRISNNAEYNWMANQTLHPDWQEFTAYDLIFPLFIFIVKEACPSS